MQRVFRLGSRASAPQSLGTPRRPIRTRSRRLSLGRQSFLLVGLALMTSALAAFAETGAHGNMPLPVLNLRGNAQITTEPCEERGHHEPPKQGRAGNCAARHTDGILFARVTALFQLAILTIAVLSSLGHMFQPPEHTSVSFT